PWECSPRSQPFTNDCTPFVHDASFSLYPSMSNHTGLPTGSPRLVISLAASVAALFPCAAAVVALVESFASPDWLTHGACKPTYSGSSFQPSPSVDSTHVEVRFVCLHARFAPPMYMPSARY